MLHKNLSITLLVFIPALVLVPAPASAQFLCKTNNCEVGTSIPTDCQNRATPRNINVAMTDGLVFVPSRPRIEGGDPAYQCIEWETTGFEPHSATEDDCDTGAWPALMLEGRPRVLSKRRPPPRTRMRGR